MRLVSELEVPQHQFDHDSRLYREDELLQCQHLQSVPNIQRLLTADLTEGVCHNIEGCSLRPIPGSPSYTVANLEHSVMGALAWFSDLRNISYYDGHGT